MADYETSRFFREGARDVDAEDLKRLESPLSDAAALPGAFIEAGWYADRTGRTGLVELIMELVDSNILDNAGGVLGAHHGVAFGVDQRFGYSLASLRCNDIVGANRSDVELGRGTGIFGGLGLDSRDQKSNFGVRHGESFF